MSKRKCSGVGSSTCRDNAKTTPVKTGDRIAKARLLRAEPLGDPFWRVVDPLSLCTYMSHMSARPIVSSQFTVADGAQL